MDQFGDANTWKFTLGPLISWNLPATSSARSHIAQAEANTAGALARFDSVVLNALRETESALTVYARELDRNAALRAARDQSALASRQTASCTSSGAPTSCRRWMRNARWPARRACWRRRMRSWRRIRCSCSWRWGVGGRIPIKSMVASTWRKRHGK
jgi:hypothetical protein